MKAVGARIKCQVTVYIIMPVDPHIKVSGKITNSMAKVNINSPTALSTKANGKIIKCTVQVST